MKIPKTRVASPVFLVKTMMMTLTTWDPEEEVTDPNPERRSIEELELPNEDQDDEGEEDFLLPPEEDE